MPGSGEIGGGSCTVKFRVYRRDPANPTDPTKEKTKTKWDAEDEDTACPPTFTVTITKPDGTTVPISVNKGEKLKIDW